MAKVKMNKVEIYGQNRDRKAIIEYLHKREIMEFSEVSEPELERRETARYISQIDSQLASASEAIAVLSEYSQKSNGILKKRPTLKSDEYAIGKAEAETVEKQIRSIIKNKRSIEENKEKISKLTAEREALAPYIALDVPMQNTETKKTYTKVGFLEGEWSRDRILNAFAEQDAEDIYLETIKTTKLKTYIWLLCPKKREERVYRVLRKIGFTEPVSEPSNRTPAQETEKLENEKHALMSESEKKRKDIAGSAGCIDDIKLFYDRLLLRRAKYEALSKVGITKNAFVMCGYIPEKCTAKIKEELEKNYGAYVISKEPSFGDDVPVAFSNNPFAAPVEGITADYSMPSAGDIDPNPIMAIFYYLFFGMMFSDAGYGLIMMIVCGVLGFGGALEKRSGKMFKMFFYCGVSTTFWGIMYGSFFGDMIATVSNTFGTGRLAFEPLLMDPTEKPLELLIMSVAFGMVHILTALCIRFYMVWRKGRRAEAVFDTGFWICVLSGASVAAAGVGTGVSAVTRIGAATAIFGVAGLIFTQGRKKKNVFSKLFGGILSLYDITSYVGDVLSYSRLMALGLATGVIASVINILGSLGGNSFAGLLLYIVISLFGHALNFSINMLGAYVHTNRLQYVEFYQKFYEGGGRKFSPLSMNTKYYN